ncbi:MAG TPA: RHS repeat-associated core domain-containing protein, partial [Opitutaceae bacterium]|nr:RHS repeat-associated core domain-containing protein [Opitutaceae bacterium]
MASGGGRSIEWTSFNQAKSITAGSLGSTFSFGASHERVIQKTLAGVTTVYVGANFEAVYVGGQLKERRHYIMTPIGRTAVRVEGGSSTSDLNLNLGLGLVRTRWFHQDGLGSITAITDEWGRVETRYAYDAWGKQTKNVLRSQGSGTAGTNGGTTGAWENSRGYTDHEMLADLGLIHMNGRVYDPVLGRFISADPFIGNLNDSQDYNHYSYVGNNPLGFTDPSGHLKLWKDVLGPIVQYIAAGYGAIPSAIVGATINGWKGAVQGFCAGLGRFIGGDVGYSFSSGFSGSLLNGGSLGDAFKAGAIGGAQAYLAGKIGDYYGHTPGDFWNEAGRAFAHGILGGAVEEARGGEFRHGFYAGFAGSVAGSLAPSLALPDYDKRGPLAILERTSFAAA